MQNLIPKLRQTSIISKKPGFVLSEKLTTIEFNIFCWHFAHVFYLVMSTKGCGVFFFILLRSWAINKIIKNECVDKIKKPTYPFVDISK